MNRRKILAGVLSFLGLRAETEAKKHKGKRKHHPHHHTTTPIQRGPGE